MSRRYMMAVLILIFSIIAVATAGVARADGYGPCDQLYQQVPVVTVVLDYMTRWDLSPSEIGPHLAAEINRHCPELRQPLIDWVNANVSDVDEP